jgi:hypothetical protein
MITLLTEETRRPRCNRLAIWYGILTPVLHCPSQLSQLDESSLSVCKPYLTLRAHLEPSISPYYQTYAAPYVEWVQPYAQTVNEHVYSPASNLVHQGYSTYAAPALSRAQQSAEKQWRAEVLPRILIAQQTVQSVYRSRVEPSVHWVAVTLQPYSDRAADWNRQYLVPVYLHSKPVLVKTYTAGQDLLASTVYPLTEHVWLSVTGFVNSAVWPTVTGLYSENVEPQLVKIGERLASYREGQKLRPVVEEVET